MVSKRSRRGTRLCREGEGEGRGTAAATVTFTVCRTDSVTMASSSHQEGAGDVAYYLYESEREVDGKTEGAVGGCELEFKSYTGVMLRWCSLTTVGVEDAIGRSGGAQ
jgi:hypothetical protein